MSRALIRYRPRSRRVIRAKRSYRRRKLSRRKRLSSKRVRQWYPDLAYTKYTFTDYGVWKCDNGTSTFPFKMANTDSEFGPKNNNVVDPTDPAARHYYHNFFLNPRINSATLTDFGYNTLIDSVVSATEFPQSGWLPDIKTTCLRYYGYRIMGVSVKVTFRAAEADGASSFTAPPYIITGVPFQMDDASKGNYWLGKSTTTQNAVTTNLHFDEVGNLRHGFVRRSRGFGGSTGQKTVSFMMYPWKVYGMTRQQWLNDPKAFNKCDTPVQYNPLLSLALADYNHTVARQYNYDFKYTVYVRWEGQKFIQPRQA